MTAILPHIDRGDAAATPPVVLLHGFAGDAMGWTGLQLALERRCRSIAFDLPGHGRALDHPTIGHAGLSAKAVLTSLDGLGLGAVHLVGHSMGGAVAALLALRQPGRVASLTLLAPGGFGRDINHRLLRRFAVARSEAEIAPLIEQFYGASARLPRRLAAQIALSREDPARTAALTTVAEAILDGEAQGTLDRAALGDLAAPVKVIWGEDDRVLPVRQAEGLPPAIAVHRLPGVGHMPHHEATALVARLVGEQAAHPAPPAA